MFRKILTMITALAMATAMFTGCVAKPETEQAPTAETTVQPEETTTTEATTTEAPAPRIRVREQANKIVSDFMNELKTNVQNVDYNAFEAMFDRNNPTFTDEAIKGNWDFFNQYFTGEKIFDIDCEVTAFDDNQIVFDTFLHWGMTDSKQYNFSYNTYPLLNQYLTYDAESDKWLWNATERFDDNLLKQRDDYYINAFGEEAYRNGWSVRNYEIIHNKALSKGLYIAPKSVVLNDDGSLDITIAVVNGLDFGKQISRFEGKIYFGPDGNNTKEVVDLSQYSGYFKGVASSKSVSLVTINVPKENLVNPVEKEDLGYLDCSSFSYSWINGN